MDKEDHLDNVISVSAEVTDVGIKASAKSRLLAGIDRLGGNLSELLNAPMEARISKQRAIARSQIQAIEAVTSLALDRLKTDPEFAARAMRGHLGSIFAEQDNKDAVLTKAMEDLRNDPPTEAEAKSGPDRLDESFLHRLDQYAKGATSEELREKWGRVLAQEVRSPKTFSPKVLRVVDEVDPEVAAAFQRLCENRLGNLLPKVLVGPLSAPQTVEFVGEDLLVDPGLGQFFPCAEIQIDSSAPLFVWQFGMGLAIAIPKTGNQNGFDQGADKAIQYRGTNPTIPVYVLTPAGTAIASIMEDKSLAALNALAGAISDMLPTSEVYTYGPAVGSDELLVRIRTIAPKELPS